MTDIQIGADGIDAEAIVQQIRTRADQRSTDGSVDMAVVARAERYNLANIKNDDELYTRFLGSLRMVATVDINDWEITDKHGRLAPFLVKFKKTIWSLLRFYTFRLWSQQNQVNGLLVGALEIFSVRTDERLEKMQKRIDELEARLAKLEGERANGK